MTEKKAIGWWEWLGWKDGKVAIPVDIPTVAVSDDQIVATTSSGVLPQQELEETRKLSGWERVKAIYEDPNSMEKDATVRIVRMSFLGGFLVGGATGYAQARHAYEMNNVKRKYLSPSDAVKRTVDYAIIRFAKGGVGTGIKCALISGSIVFLTTHISAYRDKFASWYFPAISGATACVLHSAVVGGIFTFPLGLIGSVKAVGLGISSGLTLTAVVHLYAMSVDKSVDASYKLFKRDYEKDLVAASKWDARVAQLMEQENIKWRQTAVKRLKQMDQEKLAVNDD